MTTQDPQDPPKKKSRLKKLLSGIGALVGLAVGALFTGIGEGAVNRLIDVVSPKDGPATTPATTPAATPSAVKEPLTIAVRTDIGAAGDLLALRSKESDGAVAATLKSGKIGDPWDVFLDKHDGAPVEDLVVSLVLTGHRATGIRVVNIDVEKLNIEPSLAGSSISIITQGEVESVKLTANLDEPRPTIKSDGAPYFPDKNIELKDGEQVALKFSVKATKMFYRWVFAVDFVDENGAPQRVFVNRAGNMFAQASAGPLADAFTLSGPAPKYGVVWKGNLGPGFTPAG